MIIATGKNQFNIITTKKNAISTAYINGVTRRPMFKAVCRNETLN